MWRTHPILTETVCTYLIPKYPGLNVGTWKVWGWGLQGAPLQGGHLLGKKHWFPAGD